jgi:hypothetical protein
MTHCKAIISGLAEVAQLVEQLIRNEKVGGSIPLFGTIRKKEEVCRGQAFLHLLQPALYRCTLD